MDFSNTITMEEIMKRTLAIILVLSMLVCMLPAFSLGITAEENEEPTLGLNADFYVIPGIRNHDGAYKGIIGTRSGDYEYCGYDDTQDFDKYIAQLMKVSANGNDTISEDMNVFPPYKDGNRQLPGLDGYMIQWTGTVTATTSGTYYLVGHELDNGFVAFVKQGEEMKKVYEYWAAYHWFDGAGEYALYSNKGGFTLEAGVPTEVELWYLETGGGEALNVGVSTSPDSGATTFEAAGLTFDVEGICWRTNVDADRNEAHDVIKNILGAGVTAEGNPATDNNDCLASMDGNHLFDESYEAIFGEMISIGSAVIPNFETDALKTIRQYGAYGWADLDDCLIEVDGYFTVSEGKGGVYQFGTRNVDNCLMVEVEIDGVWTRVYEFWAKNIWNDRSDTYYQVEGEDVTVTLEEGKSYGIRAYFLEINGGNPIETIVKIDGERQKFVDVVTFTTTKPTSAVKPANIALFDGSKEWYYKTSGEKNEFQIRDDAWKTDPAVYGTWEKAADPGSKWGTAENPENNQSLWAVTTFEIESLEDIAGYELMVKMSFDDNFRFYVNGELVNIELGWSNGQHTYGLVEEAADLLVEGTNTVAMKLVQGWGGSSVFVESMWLTLDENGNNPYEFKYIDKEGNKQSGIIETADEWLAYVADANERGTESNRNDRIKIAADLDFTDKTWVPLNAYVGRIFGEYHTFKNITYTATADATNGMQTVGVIVNNLVNASGSTGHIENLTIENVTFTVNATNGNGYGNAVFAGIFAGQVDRGRLENVVVKNSKLLGNPYAAGGVAGDACWNYDENGVHVENCAVIDTEINATSVAGGILGVAKNSDRVRIGNAYVKNITINAPESTLNVGGQWDNSNLLIYSTTVEGTNTIGKTLAADAEANYKFYYQTREGAEGTTDYRILCVADKEWALAQSSIKVSISFFDDSLEKSTVATANTVFEKLKAESEGLVEVYTTDADSVVFGWVVKGVPAEFLEEEPVVDLAS